MARETKAAKTSRISMLLADYNAKSSELRKLTTIVDGLKEQVRGVHEAEGNGTFGDWTLAEGTPREILDQVEAKKRLTDRGIPVPMRVTAAPMIVKPVVK
jgi:hypothetical protein